MANNLMKYGIGSTPVTGRFLAHNGLNLVGRAFLAAAINTKSAVPTDFTLTQSAYLARVNVTYAWWAKQRIAERAAIEAGLVPLVPARLVAPKANGHALVAPGESIDDATLIDFVRAVGTTRVLEAAVAVGAAQ